MADTILVAGGGGFIGGAMVSALRLLPGLKIRSVDIKPPQNWYQRFDDVENLQLDLRDLTNCRRATAGVRDIYNFAADMGGMGFIENHKADCMLSVLINTHLLVAAREGACRRYLYASSACVYAADKQTSTEVVPLKESDAYPAMPEDGYGWEKLFSERMCRHFREDYGLQTRIVRYHNIYGPHGTWDGGREKAPAAICRKVIRARLSGEKRIEVWGDGEQTRSFTYIDDCLKGTRLLMESDFCEPMNVGSEELVSINDLVGIVEEIGGVKLERVYDLSAPKGVRGRNSDNTLIRSAFGWAPATSLRHGLTRTYAWIEEQIRAGVRDG